MITEVDLTQSSYVFNEPKLIGLKKKNYIYGKNGTGKTSLVSALLDQYSDTHDIHLFNGWANIIANNETLNTIALGTENTDIQKEIEKIDSQIKEIDNEISLPNEGKENLYLKHYNQKVICDNLTNEIEKIYTDAARNISTKLSLGRNYPKNILKKDLGRENLLTKDEEKKFIMNAKIEEKSPHEKITFPEDILDEIIELTNILLLEHIAPSVVLRELLNRPDREAFARNGMLIHSRVQGEKCAFCDNTIDENRWIELDHYFSEETKAFERKLQRQIDDINMYIEQIENIEQINSKNFYPDFLEKVLKINNQILERKEAYSSTLNILLKKLENKKTNIFNIMETVDIQLSNNWNEIQKFYDYLHSENLVYSNNIDTTKKDALEKLKLHELKVELESFNYEAKVTKLNTLKGKVDELKEQIDIKIDVKTKLNREKNLKLRETINEEDAANRINELLKSMGQSSFSLAHIKTDSEHQGQYCILDYNGEQRSIQTLSDGEKNIIAFLWFMYNLENRNLSGNKKRLVIFDDPMSSNDVTLQYLMIGLINIFSRVESSPQFILLTHNNHFFMQVYPNIKYNNPNRLQAGYKFVKVGNLTKINAIKKRNEELKPLYEELWHELNYAYEENKSIFMWNTMRRILESFVQFLYRSSSPVDIENHLESVENKVLALALVKGLHVNSHIGCETDIEIENVDQKQLYILFKQIFYSAGFNKHFDKYCTIDPHF